jgi:hypothetical protein
MSGTCDQKSTLFPSHWYTGTKDFQLYCYYLIQSTILHHIKLSPEPELPVLGLNL